MDEVIRGVDAAHRRRERRFIENVPGDYFGRRAHVLLQPLGLPCKAAQPDTPGLQSAQKPAADVPGRARQKDERLSPVGVVGVGHRHRGSFAVMHPSLLGRGSLWVAAGMELLGGRARRVRSYAADGSLRSGRSLSYYRSTHDRPRT